MKFDPARALGDLQFGIGSGQNRHIGILSVPAVGGDAQDDPHQLPRLLARIEERCRVADEEVERARKACAECWEPRIVQAAVQAERKGYSGVMTLTRREPLDVIRDIGAKAHTGEGRALTLEFDDELFDDTLHDVGGQRVQGLGEQQLAALVELGGPRRVSIDEASQRPLDRLVVVHEQDPGGQAAGIPFGGLLGLDEVVVGQVEEDLLPECHLTRFHPEREAVLGAARLRRDGERGGPRGGLERRLVRVYG